MIPSVGVKIQELNKIKEGSQNFSEIFSKFSEEDYNKMEENYLKNRNIISEALNLKEKDTIENSVEKSHEIPRSSRMTTFKNKLRNSYLPPLKNQLILSTEPERLRNILFTEASIPNKDSVVTYNIRDSNQLKDENVDIFKPKKLLESKPDQQNAFNSAIMQNKYWGQQVSMGFRSNIAPKKVYKGIPKIKRINKIS